VGESRHHSYDFVTSHIIPASLSPSRLPLAVFNSINSGEIILIFVKATFSGLSSFARAQITPVKFSGSSERGERLFCGWGAGEALTQ
jgi:hypothetical protein